MSGAWVRQDAGIGAGSDSYYEYGLKVRRICCPCSMALERLLNALLAQGWLLLGDEFYRDSFQAHYASIMSHLYTSHDLFMVRCVEVPCGSC